MPENACNVHKSSDAFMSYKTLTPRAMNQHDILLGFADAILSFKHFHIKAIVGWNMQFYPTALYYLFKTLSLLHCYNIT